MAHSHHNHREHQVSHRRVDHILKHEPEGAKEHSHSNAFSKVTSKSAAQAHDGTTSHSSPKRYARGGTVKKAGGGSLPSPAEIVASNKAKMKPTSPQQGQDAMDAIAKATSQPMGKKSGGAAFARGGKVKHGHQTNIAIVVPHRGAQQPMAGAPPPGAGAPMPGGPPMGGPPGAGGPPGMPPPGMAPPGMPMHKRGGKVKYRAEGGKTDVAGDVLSFPIPMDQSDARRISGMNKPTPTTKPAPVLKGPGAAAKRGGKVDGYIDGTAKEENLKEWSARASKHSYARGGATMKAGASTGVGRLEQAEHEKHKGK